MIEHDVSEKIINFGSQYLVTKKPVMQLPFPVLEYVMDYQGDEDKKQDIENRLKTLIQR
jgi:hypothetical protein